MGGLVVGEHLLSGLAGRLVGVGTEADVRTREVEALGLRQLHEAVGQKTVGGEELGALETSNTRSLVGDEVAGRLEDREEQRLRRVSCDLGEDRNHVGVFLAHTGEAGHGTAERLEGIGERLSETLGVGVAVVDRSGRGEAKVVVHKGGHSGALVEIVVRRAVVTRAVILVRFAIKVRGQRGRGVRARDHDEAGIADERSSGGSSARARGADNTNDLFVSDDLLRSSLATLSRAEVVETFARGDLEALDVAEVGHSGFDTALVRDAEEGDIAGDRVQRTDLDLSTRLNNHGAERAVTEVVIAASVGSSIVAAGVGSSIVAAGVCGVIVIVATCSGDKRERQQNGKQHHQLA